MGHFTRQNGQTGVRMLPPVSQLSVHFKIIVYGTLKAQNNLFSLIVFRSTQTGEPTFVMCNDCHRIAGKFMANRVGRAQRATDSHICSPDDLYNMLKKQFLTDPKGQEENLKLHWPHNAFWDEPKDWEWHRQEERWVCSRMVRIEKGLHKRTRWLTNRASGYWNHPIIRYHHCLCISYQN